MALLDVPTTERRALSIADLASGSGLTRPQDTASLPLDDSAYREASGALRRLGLVDPLGERLEAEAAARSDGRLHLEFLKPDVELRGYYLGGVDRRQPYHSAGDRLYEGLNGFLSAAGAAFWGDWLGGEYDVRIQQHPEGFDSRAKRLYVKAVAGKWSFKVGRDTIRLGPGYHGSLLLDDNAPPLDLWGIRTEEPLFLPGWFSNLGGFRLWLFNAYLNDSNPEPVDARYGSGVKPIHDPRLLGMRFSYHPTYWFDLGFSRAIMYGGKGREAYNSPKDWWELFSASHENVRPGESHRYDNDQYASFDATLRLPFLNGLGPLKAGKVYWEHGGTDLNAPWQGDGWGILIIDLTNTANIAGLYLSTAVTDLRVEFAKIHDRWYRHGVYSQGYTYRGRPLGHPMGADSEGWFAELSRYLTPEWQASVSLDLEKRGLSQPDTERRTEWGLSLTKQRALGLPVSARVNLLWADVKDPLDDPGTGSRTEILTGLELSLDL